jgi:predicted RNA-binding Zn-ribbon protein involved in translation (DUF1610 family)
MIKVRFYALALSLPFMVTITGIVLIFAGSHGSALKAAGEVAFVSGVAVHILFALMFVCPKCGKSPYAIGPTFGPFALGGKPIPDRRCSRCGFDFIAEAEAVSRRDSEDGSERR